MITITGTPSGIQPAFTNAMIFTATSSYATQSNFRFYFDYYDINQLTSTPTFKIRVDDFPRYQTRIGLYTPHQITQAYCNTELQHTITNFTVNEHVTGLYTIKVGEIFDPGLTFSDTVYSSGFLGLTFGVTHSLLVNDIITIDKLDKSININYDGTSSITSVVNAYQVVTNKPWGDNSFLESGQILSVERQGATISNYRYFNGTKQFEDITTNFENTYVMASSSKLFLTKWNSSYEKRITLTDFETLTFIPSISASASNSIRVITYNSSGSIIGTFFGTSSVSTSIRAGQDIPVGPENLLGIVGSFIGVDKYIISIGNKTGGIYTKYSKDYTYKIDTICTRYTPVRLAWKNSLGGIDYFSFKQDHTRSVDYSTKEIYLQNPYNYDRSDRGKKTISSNGIEKWQINSDMLTETEALFLQDLFNKTDAYLITSSGQVPIQVISSNYDEKTIDNSNGYIQYTIDFIKANDIITNA